MKANELRIRNYVIDNRDDSIHKVTGGTIHSYEFSNKDILKPIPLTEDWLLKFGFDKHSINPFWFRKKQLCISLVGKVELTSWDMQIFKIDTEINHVHQLQNLYFALTGCELEIK